METETTQGGGKTPWHPAFLQAIQQELFDYRDSLEFKYEYSLTSEPLRVDLLIIKKPKNLTIDKNIARIFRTDNLLEYKSPDDYLALNDYLKVYAYANLYAAITSGVDFADLTLTFIENRHPRKLLRYLTEIRGYTIDETSPGIYLVSGDYLPIQIIESRKLSERENLWLKSLTKDLQVSSLDSILDEVRKRGDKASLGAYLDILFRMNKKAFLEGINMARRRLPTLDEVLAEAGLLPRMIELGKQKLIQERQELIREGIQEGMQAAARNALDKGLPVDVIHDITGLDIETIKELEMSR
jgi:hypothetical protein